MAVEPQRVLFVHAHPDDETISTGGTIATLVDRGDLVTVLTCTRGERGEVIPASLAHLEGDHTALAAHREGELAAALRELGVHDHRFLGDPGARWTDSEPRRYIDSGMRWGADGAEPLDALDPEAFSTAVFGEAAADIAAVISETRPHVVVSYDERGGYGHPDHRRAHSTARRAAEVMGVPFWTITEGRLHPAGQTISVDVSPVLDRKVRALRAHESQVVVSGETFALSNGVSSPIARSESFTRLPPPVEPTGAFRELSVSGKIFSIVVAAAFGALAGLVFTVAHQATAVIGGVVVPWGIIVALAATTSLLLGLRLAFDSRVLPIAALVAVLALVSLLALPTDGGSILVPANLAGYAWSFGPTLIAVVVLAWPRARPRITGESQRGNIEGLPAPKGSRIP